MSTSKPNPVGDGKTPAADQTTPENANQGGQPPTPDAPPNPDTPPAADDEPKSSSRAGRVQPVTFSPAAAKMIRALLEEREGYVRADKTERVKAVDKALEAYGTTAAKAARALAEHDKSVATAGPDGGDPNQKMIDALLDERERYVRMDNKDRVGQVDEQLRHYGVANPAKAAKERAQVLADRNAPPNAQRAGQQQTR